MIYVGIDVSKFKHDCIIINSDGEIIEDVFQIQNDIKGFNNLKSLVLKHLPNNNLQKLKVGLESTGHYSNNIINFIHKNNFPTTIFNPLSTNLYRKSQTLRKTKTDKIDTLFIATMLFSDNSNPYSPKSYHINEIKSLSRHRFRLVGYRAKLKISYTRILDIIFPEIASAVWSIHQNSILSLLLELPTTKDISECHLTKLTNLLSKSSKGKYGKEKALLIKDLAKNSIGTVSLGIAFELQQTIRLIQNIHQEIKLLDKNIKQLMDELNSPLMTIPGISYTLASIILSEIGDINNFSNSAKLLAFSGLEPSTHQSGKYTASYSRMVKRGSKYLRWALINAARLTALKTNTFNEYFQKKRSEGKHYLVALSHVAKKLIRVIFHLLKTDTIFID
jgi:transposase